MKGLSLPRTFLCERIFDRDMHTYVVSKETSDGFIDNYAVEHISMHLKHNVFSH